MKLRGIAPALVAALIGLAAAPAVAADMPAKPVYKAPVADMFNPWMIRLRALGVSGSRPSLELAHTEPLRYLSELSSAGEAAELLDPSGLGGFSWVWTAADAAAVRRASRALSA